MKKSIPLVACALMLAVSPAFALDAATPATGTDTQPGVAENTTTETRTEALQTQSTPSGDAVKSTVNESTEVEAKTSPVVEGQAQPQAQTQTQTESNAAASEESGAVTGTTQTTTETEVKTTAPNVQKLFGLFHPNKQAEATPGSDTQKQDTPASTQNTQTPQ